MGGASRVGDFALQLLSRVCVCTYEEALSSPKRARSGLDHDGFFFLVRPSRKAKRVGWSAKGVRAGMGRRRVPAPGVPVTNPKMRTRRR